MPGLGLTFLTRVVTRTHRSPLTGSPGTRYITCQHHIYKGIIYCVNKLQIQWANIYYLTAIPVMFLVPISLSASLLTDWALGSQAQGEWTGAGAGAEPGARSRDRVGGMLLLGNRLIYFLMGPSREADMSQLELYVKFYICWKLKLLKIHLLHISVKIQSSKSC